MPGHEFQPQVLEAVGEPVVAIQTKLRLVSRSTASGDNVFNSPKRSRFQVH